MKSSKDMFNTLVKKRHGYIRFLLFIQLLSYSLLWFNWEYNSLEYLYMIKTFKGTNSIFRKHTFKGVFQLLDLIITKLKSHMTFYNLMPLIG